MQGVCEISLPTWTHSMAGLEGYDDVMVSRMALEAGAKFINEPELLWIHPPSGGRLSSPHLNPDTVTYHYLKDSVCMQEMGLLLYDISKFGQEY